LPFLGAQLRRRDEDVLVEDILGDEGEERQVGVALLQLLLVGSKVGVRLDFEVALAKPAHAGVERAGRRERVGQREFEGVEFLANLDLARRHEGFEFVVVDFLLAIDLVVVELLAAVLECCRQASLLFAFATDAARWVYFYYFYYYYYYYNYYNYLIL
jgi:hypothetical protein